MKYKLFGRSGLRVSELALGASSLNSLARDDGLVVETQREMPIGGSNFFTVCIFQIHSQRSHRCAARSLEISVLDEGDRGIGRAVNAVFLRNRRNAGLDW